MTVPCVRIDGTTGLILDGDLHLLGARDRYTVAWGNRAVVGNHDRKLVSVFFMDGAPVEGIAVYYEHVRLGTFAGDRADRQNDSVAPLLHGHAQLDPLSRLARISFLRDTSQPSVARRDE